MYKLQNSNCAGPLFGSTGRLHGKGFLVGASPIWHRHATFAKIDLLQDEGAQPLYLYNMVGIECTSMTTDRF